MNELDQLDALADDERMVHLLAGYEFPWDFIRSLELALMRSYTIPRISRLLDVTGEFRERGQKRYDDTAILVAEFLKHGYSSERGTAAIDRMNEQHAKFSIRNEDYLFVLSTFVLDPIDWMAKFGRRPMSEREADALCNFWIEVGRRMHLSDIPADLAALREFAHNYTRDHCRYDDANQRLAEATLTIASDWLPTCLRWLVKPAASALMDKPMRDAFGFPAAPWPIQLAVTGMLKLRRLALRLLPRRKKSAFFCDAPTRTYGACPYHIDQLGPCPRANRDDDTTPSI